MAAPYQTAEEANAEDERAEQHVFRLLVGTIQALNWTDPRAMVSILRALQLASLSLVSSHPRRAVSREAAEAGKLRLMEVLVEWASAQPLCDQHAGDATPAKKGA